MLNYTHVVVGCIFHFFLCYAIKLPVLEFLLIFSICIRVLVFGKFYKDLILVVLFFVYVFCVLDALDTFKNIKSFVSEIQKDLLIFKNHKEDEFSLFYIMEKQYIYIFLFSSLFFLLHYRYQD